MGCKGSEVQILSPRPILTLFCVGRKWPGVHLGVHLPSRACDLCVFLPIPREFIRSGTCHQGIAFCVPVGYRDECHARCCPRAPAFLDPPGYARHRPEATLLYQLVEQHYPAFREMRAEVGRPLPDFVEEEFEAYLKCGRLEEGFLRLRCEHWHAEKLVAFSCKKRGFCPSCGARCVAETAALLADEVLPERPLRQWVLSLPHASVGCWRNAGWSNQTSRTRLAMTSSGQVRYQLKTPYRDGTTHIVMEPLDLIARLAALIPPPADAPDALSRRVRSAQPAAGEGDASEAWSGSNEASRSVRPAAATRDAQTRGERCCGSRGRWKARRPAT